MLGAKRKVMEEGRYCGAKRALNQHLAMKTQHTVHTRNIACCAQVSGGRVSNAWMTCPWEGDNSWKRLLIPHKLCKQEGWHRKGGESFR